MADLTDYANQLAQNQTFTTDTISFLNYINTGKGLRLTQTSKNLTLKDVRAINSQFLEPEELDIQLGDHLYKLRTEQEAKRVHFIRCLCQTARLVKIRKGWISQTKRATEFLAQSPFQQLFYLFITWWQNDDWGRFLHQPELANLYRDNVDYFTDVFEAMPPNSVTQFASFAKTTSDRIGYVVDSNNQRDQQYTDFLLELVLIRPLELFGVVTADYNEAEYKIKIIKSFGLTSLGKIMFEQLLFLEEDLEEDLENELFSDEIEEEDDFLMNEEVDTDERFITEMPYLSLLEEPPEEKPTGNSIKKAVSDYLAELKKTASDKKFTRHKECLELFLDYINSYTESKNLKDLGPGHFREFLSYWYIKKAGMSATHAVDTLRAAKQLAMWLDQNRESNLCAELKEDFQRLGKDFPAVFKVSDALWEYDNAKRLLAEPIFEQFLKMGGEEAKKILKVEDVEPFNPDNVNYDQLEEGYFEITNIRKGNVEVTPYGGGEPIFPVRFPKQALPWLRSGFIINLAIAPNMKTGDWEILEHGFVYPE